MSENSVGKQPEKVDQGVQNEQSQEKVGLPIKPAFCEACAAKAFYKAPSTQPPFHIYYCMNCGLGQTFPLLAPTELDEFYQTDYYGEENKKFISVMERMVGHLAYRRANWLKDLVPNGSTILDIGCGRGILLKLLTKWKNKGVGIERSEHAATKARSTPGIEVFTKPFEECELAPESFEMVILWHVFEHLGQPVNTLKRIHGILKQDGVLVIEVPNIGSWQSKLSHKFWFHLDIERHLFHYTEKSLRIMMEKQGFAVLETGTFSLEQGPYGALQSVLNLIIRKPELFYKILKREISISGSLKLFHFALAGLLAFPAFIFSLFEALFGKGGVMRIVVRKM